MVLSISAACQNMALYLANLPTDDSRYVLTANIDYAEKPWQKLDVYTPAGITSPAPVIVYFYGGGWSQGQKGDYLFVADRLVEEGFVVVIADYAKFPDHLYPTYVEDAAAVTRWLKDNIASYQGDAQNMHIMGHSAGAHIAAMLLADKRFLATHALNPSAYRSFIGLAGPYNFEPTLDKFKRIFGGGPDFRHMKAPRFIDGTEPPMLLLHGGWDSIVGSQNYLDLQKAVRDHGGSATGKQYDQVTHYGIIGAFSRALPTNQAVVRDTIAFLKQQAL